MFSSSDPAILSEKLSGQYSKLADYMGNNKLVINDDKTPKYFEKRKLVSINTGTVVVQPIETEKLLGINIHQ